ncbi:MAG: glycosyl hydrolase family 28-related protein [Micavibrio sp.]
MPDHIKMPDVTPIIRCLADGAETVFTYPFPVFASEDLAVYFDGARQAFGFTIDGAGTTEGGTVTFDTAPANGIVITLERLLPLERVTDFIEGGDFSARAINNELDYLTAGLQQVCRLQGQMLRYGDHEIPGAITLPDRTLRANKALGFDASGNPLAVSLDGSMAAPDYTASGAGATTRTSTDKFNDCVSVRDFGAVGDGLADDTLAFQKALSAHDSVFVPDGAYLLTGTVTIGERQSLSGSGQKAVIKCAANTFPALELAHGYAQIEDLRIEGGDIGILLRGRLGPCVQNNISDVTIWGANTGVQLDGYTDTAKPCYWNNFSRILVAQPVLHGFHLTKSGAGDTPNANRFHICRAYSLGADTTGSGFYIEHGQLNNSFLDCEANLAGTAAACFRLGAGSSKTLLLNPFAESSDLVPNVRLDAGSMETAIFNLTAQSDGAAMRICRAAITTRSMPDIPTKTACAAPRSPI